MSRLRTTPHNPDVIRRDLEGWCDKLKNNSVEADTRNALDALIHDARKLLRDMESVLQQQRDHGGQD